MPSAWRSCEVGSEALRRTPQFRPGGSAGSEIFAPYAMIHSSSVALLRLRQIELLPNNAVELTVNLDSMVEMPRATVEFYIQHIARFSRAFFANNREGNYNTWRGFSLAVRTYMTQSRTHPWNLVLQNRSWIMPPPYTYSHMSAHVMMHGKVKHMQLFLRRLGGEPVQAAERGETARETD